MVPGLKERFKQAVGWDSFIELLDYLFPRSWGRVRWWVMAICVILALAGPVLMVIGKITHPSD